MATVFQNLAAERVRRVAPEAEEGKGKPYQAGPYRYKYVTGRDARQKTARLEHARGPRGNARFGPSVR